MKISLNPKTLKTGYELDRQDIMDALEVRKTLESRGWGILKGLWNNERENVLDRGKVRVMTKTGELTNTVSMANLEGYDRFLAVPEDYLYRVDSYIEEQEELKRQNEGG